MNNVNMEIFELFQIFELFELLDRDYDKDFSFVHKKALVSYALYERLVRLYGREKAAKIFNSSKKNFGSVAFYKANPILWASFNQPAVITPTIESYNHLKNAFIIDVPNQEIVRQFLISRLLGSYIKNTK